MKKFEKGKRFLTFLLVALMVVQQSSVTTLAEELAEYTQEAQNQDTEAVAEVSEASEPEASVPDSDKAQEQQPAAEEPAAPAEQETAEVTEAPQATEAPAQETAPTEAPAQEAEQTEAPQENAAVKLRLLQRHRQRQLQRLSSVVQLIMQLQTLPCHSRFLTKLFS